MYNKVKNFLLLIPLLLVFSCSSGTSNPPASSAVSYNTAIFDPYTGEVPLPNILATATATDPLIGRAVNKPMSPFEALAYVNLYEMNNTHAVSGLNAPIYIRFQKPVNPATVTPVTIKVFQVGIDSNGLTENGRLTFIDISTMFNYKYTTGSTDMYLFPNFPLLPGARYLYVVTSGVKDLETGRSLSGSFYFEALKANTPLPEGFAALELLRNNTYYDAGKTAIKLSGYAKVMDDLIAASSTTMVASRDDIALLGRFITTGAGFVSKDAIGTMMPVESALRAFAAGATMGGLSDKTWYTPTNASTNLNTVAVTTPPGLTPAAYWAAARAGTAPNSVSAVVTGTINSAELSIDPVVARANASAIDLTAVPNAYNPAAGVLQPFRSPTGKLNGFYYKSSTVPFVLITPTTPAGKVVIFQHGISGQKEQVVAVAGSLTAAGYTVLAIDLPLHGALAVPTHTTGDVWAQDFLAVGAPLAIRSNIQQAAFNLHRFELTARTGGFASLGIIPPALPAISDIKYVGIDLGSIVGAYYLAGSTTLSATGVQYTQTTLNSDMKGFLSVPGGRLAYLLQNSPALAFGVNAALSANGVVIGTSIYHNFFQVTQSVIDPVDPATITTPLSTGLPSRLSGRIAIQEAIGDQVFPNDNTRYFGNALGGRGILGKDGAAVAPGFKQLGYRGGTYPRIPALFMYDLVSGIPTPKVDFAAVLNALTITPPEGYFQFDNTGISHGFLIDPSNPVNIALAQAQMVSFLLRGAVVDPQ